MRPTFCARPAYCPCSFSSAIALVELWALLARHNHERWGALVVGLLLALGPGLGVHAYWRHVHSPAAFYNFEAGPAEMAAEVNTFLGSGWQGGFRVLRATALAGRHVYVAPRLWQNWPSMRYLCPQSSALTTEPSDRPIVPSTPAEDVLLVLWPFEDNRAFLPLLPAGRVIAAREGAQERGDLEQESRLLYFTLRTLPPSVAPANIEARWQEGIRLVGYAVQPRGARQLLVTLYWRLDKEIAKSYTVFCHITRAGQRIGQHDGPPAGGYYPTDLWRPRDTVADTHTVDLSEDCAPGACRLVVGLYAWETMERLPLLDAEGRASPETALSVEFSPAPQPAGAPN